MHLPHDPVEIVEVGPRDGLQNLSTVVPTKQKMTLIRNLAQTGLKKIQIGGFVSPKAIPQFHDIEAVAEASLATINDTAFSVLTANLKGVENALARGIKHITFVFSVSDAHNRKNVNKSPEASVADLEKIIQRVSPNPDVRLSVDLATAFGCPYTPAIPPEKVLHYISKIQALGVQQVTLCDTVGFGNPRQVAELISDCYDQFPGGVFRCHFHNTRGLGLANALAAYAAGIRSFDASIGGMGGCPYAPGATGNISTEDLVFMFNEMGVVTGVDLEKLLTVTSYVKEILPDVCMESQLFRAKAPQDP